MCLHQNTLKDGLFRINFQRQALESATIFMITNKIIEFLKE